MKIIIAGSVTFAKEQLNIKKELELVGYEVLVSDDLEDYINRPSIKLSFDEELKLSKEYDVLRNFYNKVSEGDALLVCNYDKNGIKGYLGTSVLIEIGLAYYLKKKVFILNNIDIKQNYAMEISIMEPTILDGDLSNIK